MAADVEQKVFLMWRKQYCHQRGFTLLEIMAAMCLLVFGVVPVVNVMSSAIVADQTVEREVVAMALVQEKMEAIKASEDWASVRTQAVARSNIGDPFAHYDREVTITGVAPDPDNFKEVRVVVYWTSQGVEEQASAGTLLTNLTP